MLRAEDALRVPRKAVASSHLASVGYDVAGRTLVIEFGRGQLYAYGGVPPEVAAELVSAPSIGRYFDVHIQGRYPHLRLVPPQEG
jgi:hypothetical protein